jgi:hypothetical protein
VLFFLVSFLIFHIDFCHLFPSTDFGFDLFLFF